MADILRVKKMEFWGDPKNEVWTYLVYGNGVLIFCDRPKYRRWIPNKDLIRPGKTEVLDTDVREEIYKAKGLGRKKIMTEAYILAKALNNGDEVLLDIYDSEEAVKQRILKEAAIAFDSSGRVLISNVTQFRVRKYQVNSIPKLPTEPTVDLPTKSITVTSESDPTVTYGVAVDSSGNAVGCTCKSFEYGNGSSCKHMRRVQLSTDTNGVLGTPRVPNTPARRHVPWYAQR